MTFPVIPSGAVRSAAQSKDLFWDVAKKGPSAPLCFAQDDGK
jgi:hypothetical protein